MRCSVSCASPSLFFENHLDSCWPVGRNLFANAQMQAHVQERVGLGTFYREVFLQIAADRRVVFGMFSNDIGDLLFQRR